jgi:hypothetical protein
LSVELAGLRDRPEINRRSQGVQRVPLYKRAGEIAAKKTAAIEA